MWANVQRDGRPTEYRWRPLFNAAKFGWRPLLECRAVTLLRRETRWNLQGWPELANRSQPLVGRSSPYYQDMWRMYCSFTIFSECRCMPYFRRCSATICAIVPTIFLRPVFQLAACSTFQTCIINSHQGHTMCGSMVDSQSPTAEIRRAKKKKER